MAKDFPEYERQEIVQPVTHPVGFTEAFGEHAKVYDAWAQLGSQIAQNASNQMTQQRAIEAAQTPGRNLWPALTQADAQFNQVYKEEEANVLDFRGKQQLRKMYEDFNKIENLSGQDLLTFEENGKKSIQEILNYSNSTNKPALNRSLQQQYESFFYNLSNRVNANNQKFLTEEAAAQLQQKTDEIDDTLRKRTPESDQIYIDPTTEESAIQKRNEAIILLHKQADRENWPAEKFIAKEEEILDRFESGKEKAVYERLPEKDKPKHIATIRERLPKNISASRQDRIVADVQQFATQYDGAFKTQQNINYTNLLTKLNEGKLSQADVDVAVLNNNINANQIADLALKQTKLTGTTNRIHQEATGIVDNYDKPIYLANTTDAPRNYAVDKMMIPQAERMKGSPLNLTEQAQLLSNFKAPVESYQKRLTAALNAGTPQDKLDAASAIGYAKEHNPLLTKGMSKTSLSLADMINYYSKNPAYQTEEGLQKLSDKIFKIDDNTLKERERMVSTYFKDKQYHDYDFLRQDTYKALDLKYNPKKPNALPAGLTTVYLNNLRDGIMRTGEKDIAEAEAKQKLKTYYGEDKTGKVSYMPPEKAYTDLGYVLQNDKLRSVKNMVDENKQIRADGGFVIQELEWDNAPDFSDLTKGPLHNWPPRIRVNGYEREVVVDSDVATQMSPLNQLSWGLGYLDENNIFNPIINPFAKFGSYRFFPDSELYMKAESNPAVKYKILEEEQRQNIKEMTDYEKSQLELARYMQKTSKQMEESETYIGGGVTGVAFHD